jgi:hypothetical protein
VTDCFAGPNPVGGFDVPIDLKKKLFPTFEFWSLCGRHGVDFSEILREPVSPFHFFHASFRPGLETLGKPDLLPKH